MILASTRSAHFSAKDSIASVSWLCLSLGMSPRSGEAPSDSPTLVLQRVAQVDAERREDLAPLRAALSGFLREQEGVLDSVLLADAVTGTEVLALTSWSALEAADSSSCTLARAKSG